MMQGNQQTMMLRTHDCVAKNRVLALIGVGTLDSERRIANQGERYKTSEKSRENGWNSSSSKKAELARQEDVQNQTIIFSNYAITPRFWGL